ncbi:MAG: APC family permease [Candidatus Odinarchaeia archaeon]
MAEEKEVFVRKASGLTRVISAWDALIYAFCNPGILYAMLYITWGPWGVGPGADMPFAVVTVFMLLPIQALYWLFSVSMPRSGGEYLYVSRIISPAWGLFSSWTLTIIGMSWSGQCTTWMINYGIANLFWNQGVLTQDKGLLDIGYTLSDNSIAQYGGPASSCALIWGIVTISLITTFLIMWRGAKASMRLSWVSTTLATIGLLAFAVAAITAGESVFTSRVDALWSALNADPDINAAGYFAYTSYAAYRADVVAAGYPGYSSIIGTIFAGTAYVNLNTLGSTYTTSAAGEIKGVSFAQGLALIGSIILFMGYWELFYGTAYIGTGSDFWWGIAWAEYNGLDYAAFGGMASGMSIVPYLTDNPVLVHLTTIGFIGATYGSVLGMSFGPVRNMFAWSFDGILPNWWNKVDRRGSPYVSVAAAGIIAWTFASIYLWTTLLALILYTITVWFIGWCVVSIAGIVFPWRRKDIFEKSPELVKKKIGGLPVVSILGAISLGVSAFTVYVTIAPSLVYGWGVDATALIGTVLFLIIIPFILYYGAYFYRKSRGVPMDLRFKEIPPD